jgi:hypothetical protein
MTVIVEDGTQVANANSYDSVANIEAYALARGVTLTGTEVLIHKAMDWIEIQPFQGYKKTSTQALQWPRNGVLIDNYAFATDEIPTELKNALAALCMEIFAGNNPNAAIARATKKTKVGPIEIEYTDNASETVITPAVTNPLSKLLANGGSGFEFSVDRDCEERRPNYYDDLGWWE